MSNLPNDRETEEALLGSIFINPACLREGEVASLEPEDFFIVKHKWVLESMRAVGTDLDVVSVSADLNNRGRLDDVGGSAYLTALISRTPSAMHVQTYAKTVKSLAVRRRDIEIAQRIAHEAGQGEIDRAKFIDLLANNQDIDGKAHDIGSYMREFVASVEERSQDPKEIWGIPTGFTDLDNRIGGLQPEQTIMLAAPPGRGKSVLAMQIAKNVAEQGYGVAIYSFEMSARRVLMRLMSAESNIPTRAMNTGRMDDYWGAFYRTAEAFEKLGIYISDVYGMKTSEVRADVSRLVNQHNIKLIVVDYLNKLLDRDGGDDIANTKLKAERIQAICREFQVGGILIQSMNKDGMRGSVPTMADMSGPGAVAHEGDNVFLMGEDAGDSSLVKLYPAKMRDGDMGHAPITLKWVEGVPKFANYRPVKLEWLREQVR